MKKKFLLLVLTVCLLFCLNISSCDDDFNKESVTGLWDRLRNTAWSMREDNVTITVGFYGPMNGPRSKWDQGTDTSYGYIDREGNYCEVDLGIPRNEAEDFYKYPYCYIRISTDDGFTYSESFDRLQISRTGKISESLSDAYVELQKKLYHLMGLGEYEKPFMRSFNVSVSGDKLTISGLSMKGEGRLYLDHFVSPDEAPWETVWSLNSYIPKMGGTYSIYKTEKDFNFKENDVSLQFWSQVKDTAWTKQGESQPSIGFYQGGGGPESSIYSDYIYFKKSAITEGVRLNYIGGGYFRIYSERDLYLKITVSNNTLTISNIRVDTYWGDGFTFNDTLYTEAQLREYFIGTYTRTSNSPTYVWP